MPDVCNTFEPGEFAIMIVGLPGPEVEHCQVIRRNPDGTYQVRFQVHGQGRWHEGVGYPNKQGIGGLFKGKPGGFNG